jgi:hypothetical protein
VGGHADEVAVEEEDVLRLQVEEAAPRRHGFSSLEEERLVIRRCWR